MTGLLVLYVGLSVLFIALAIPLIQKRVPPNGIYGFRVPKTLNNPDIWYAVNAHFAVRMMWVGIITLIMSLVLFAIPGLSVDAYSLLVLAVIGIGLLIAIVQSFAYMNSFPV